MPTFNMGIITSPFFLSPSNDLAQAVVYGPGSLVFALDGDDTFQTYQFGGRFDGAGFVGGAGDDRLVVKQIDTFGPINNTFYGGNGQDVLEFSATTPFAMSPFLTKAYDPSFGRTFSGEIAFYGVQASLTAFDVERFVIKGSVSSDILRGSTGDDWLDGRGGQDQFFGSAGDDGYVFDSSSERVSGLDAGVDTIWTTASQDLRNSADVENLRLQSGDINGTGNALANLITGSDGRNVIAGGAGKDSLYGKGGADIFAFAEMGTASKDSIWDFDEDDKIQLSQSTFAGLDKNGDGFVDMLSQTGKAIGSDAQLVYNKNTGILSYDADGTGAGAAEDIAFIGKKLGFLDTGDFILAA